MKRIGCVVDVEVVEMVVMMMLMVGVVVGDD